MKRLYLLRHAKSDWHSGSDDHQRPLNPRGRQAAARMGRFLRDTGQIPDAVSTSSAVRAHSTVELAAEAGGWPCPIRVVSALYLGAPPALLAEIHRQDERHERLLLAGHEPGWSQTVGGLVGGGYVRMVTAAIARIDLAVTSWRQVDLGSGQLAWLVTPKLLGRLGYE